MSWTSSSSSFKRTKTWSTWTYRERVWTIGESLSWFSYLRKCRMNLERTSRTRWEIWLVSTFHVKIRIRRPLLSSKLIRCFSRHWRCSLKIIATKKILPSQQMKPKKKASLNIIRSYPCWKPDSVRKIKTRKVSRLNYRATFFRIRISSASNAFTTIKTNSLRTRMSYWLTDGDFSSDHQVSHASSVQRPNSQSSLRRSRNLWPRSLSNCSQRKSLAQTIV